MKNLIRSMLISTALAASLATPAMAHDVVRDAYYAPVHYRTVVVRSSHMPDWLKHDRQFKDWYKHSHLKSNRYLSWQQVRQVYFWECQYARSSYAKPHIYYGSHDYEWYRRYWRDQQQHKRYYRR